jgi:hypothetical protein
MKKLFWKKCAACFLNSLMIANAFIPPVFANPIAETIKDEPYFSYKDCTESLQSCEIDCSSIKELTPASGLIQPLNSSAKKNLKKQIEKEDQGGPSMPEIQGFTPASSDKLVDLSTGDLNYNILLLNVGGYPINLSYSSGTRLNDEASWVGLGWTLNPGSVNRNVRGLPDDFSGEIIEKNMNILPKESYSIGAGIGIQYAGFEFGQLGLGLNIEFEYDNYEGWGVKTGLNANSRIGPKQFGADLGVGLGVSSRGGGYMSPSFGLSGSFEGSHTETSLGANVGMNIESREGLKNLSFGLRASAELTKYGSHEIEGHRKSELGKFSGSFPLNFASSTFTPPFEIPTFNEAGELKLALGGAVNSVYIHGEVSGSFSKQTIQNQISKNAFGYMYSQLATPEDLLDLNREKDGVFQKEIPNLPLTAFTHDIYMVSGQFGGGTFRPMRMDLGTLHDPYHKNTTFKGDGGAEVGVGNIVHVGIDLNLIAGTDEVKKWEHGNHSSDVFAFKDTTDSPLYEPVYFKNLGEHSAMQDTSLFNKLGGFKAIRPALTQAGPTATADASNSLTNGFAFDQPAIKLQRDKRGQLMSWRTIQEIRNSNEAHRDLMYRIDNNSGFFSDAPFSGPGPSSNQMGEICVTDANGNRMVYGLPVYNNFIKEVSFNIQEPSTLHASPHENQKGFTSYSNADATIKNTKGENNFFVSTLTPTHAYGWLITSVLSDDYEDIDYNGPTPDDLGNYTLFTYKKTHRNFLWRTPIDSMQALFQEGLTHTHNDNKASYVFGGKEIYYLDSIATRNYVAVFHSSPRADALGVRGEHGGINPRMQLNKLDSIQLFTFAEIHKNASERIPLKTVHFEYDYSLCPGQINTTPPSPSIVRSEDNTGKLSLRKVYFTYAKSIKQKESPYIFHYTNNYTHQPKNVDRWGHYKREDPNISNDRFPYANQIKFRQDSFASAWHLNKIQLPLGGDLIIEYESDDYAFVQDKRAMNMTKIAGISSDRTFREGWRLYGSGRSISDVYKYIFLELPHGFPRTREALFEYIKGIEELYFSVSIQVTTATAHEEATYEVVNGFIPVHFSLEDFRTNFGFQEEYPNNKFWIQLPAVEVAKDPELNNVPEYSYVYSSRYDRSYRHPFTQAGFQFIMSSLPKLINPAPPEAITLERLQNTGDLNRVFENLGRAFDEVFSGGIFNYLQNNQRCNQIDISKSFVRLNNPIGKKLGGGSRVKKVVLKDNWGKMHTSAGGTQLDFQYGSEYFYNDGEKSSGVASYEPMIGADENPLVLPIHYKIQRKLAIDVNNYQLQPVGELFYPAPQIIYSKVTQRNLPYEKVKRHAMGYTVSEFYTARDFPVRTSQTDKYLIAKNFTLPFQIYNRSENTVTVSQGFVIELNNMHGQQKSVKVYDEYNHLISSLEYIYQTDESGKLNNYVKTVDPTNGIVTTNLCGVHYEGIMDANNYTGKQEGGGVQLNIEVFMSGIYPVVLIIPIPIINQFYTEYRGITFTKVISRNGILQAVRTQNLGAVSVNKNLAYDPNTGSVLVTESDNEFSQKYYSVNLPAYWAYPNMGFSSINHRLLLQNKRITGAQFLQDNATSLFTNGDELILKRVSDLSFYKVWIYRVDRNTVYLIKENGDPFNVDGLFSIRIFRSGFRNKLSGTAGSFVTSENPLLSTLNLRPDRVLSCDANEYSDFWQTDYGFRVTYQQASCDCSINFPNLKTKQNKKLNFQFDIKNNTQANVKVLKDRIIISLPDGCDIIISTVDGKPFGVDKLNVDFFIPELNERECNPGKFLTGTYTSNSGKRNVILSSDCYTLINCVSEPGQRSGDCGLSSGIQNPFLTGILGHFKLLTTYQYVTNRRTEDRIYNSGYLTDYTPYWIFGSNGLIKNTSLENWQRTDSIITINSRGKTLEAWNALNIPSSTFYQHGKVLTAAVSQNAYYPDIAYDGFEDYKTQVYRFLPPWAACNFQHHNRFTVDRLDLLIERYIDESKSHSGTASLKVEPGLNPFIHSPLLSRVLNRESRSSRIAGTHFEVKPVDIISNFSPRKNINYLISAWVHRDDENLSNFDRIKISVNGVEFSTQGPIIDGWQQIYGEFSLADIETSVRIELKNKYSTGDVWFDDIRIQPVESMMETFSFSASKLRMDAKHDDQNYTNFFEYDAEGKAERFKKETESGIFTLEEVRSELPKNNR